MENFIKKTLLTSIGLASITKDKIEEEVKKFVVQGKLSKEEGNKMAEDLIKEVEETKKNLSENIEKTVNKSVKKLNFASKKDIEKLQKKIQKLEDLINEKLK